MHRTLDRLPSFDEASRRYNIEALEDRAPRSYTWACNSNLDQGAEGACVGFGWTHEANARPWVHAYDDDFAFGVYHAAQQVDEWEGEDYEGTSVLAGAKVMRSRGLIGEYRWAFGLTGVLQAIGWRGPVVFGLNWYEGMFDTDEDGYIEPLGRWVGGHCLIGRGVDMRNERVLLHNSWGPDWGGTPKGPGTAWISFSDLARLLDEDGEACIPVVRY